MKLQKTLVSCFLLLSLISCSNKTSSDVSNSISETDSLNSKPEGGNGKVFITLTKPENAEYNTIYETLTTHHPMDAILQEFNTTLDLPNDIEVVFEECDEENAFYNPETKKISVCYELINKYVASLDQKITFAEKVQQATTFTLFHELGHAMVDQLDLPITGKEESAVDEFALMMLLDSKNETAIDLAVEGVLQFYYDSLNEDDIDFMDVHSPNRERYFDLLALYIGAGDVEEMKVWIGEDEGQLSFTRAEGATDEYNLKRKSWDTLLIDFYKE